MMKIPALGVIEQTVVSAAGESVEDLWGSLVTSQTGLQEKPLDWCDLSAWLGPVHGVDDVVLPEALQARDCRNHRLAWLALQEPKFREAITRQKGKTGASRIGLILGTSTSGIRSTEQAYAIRQSSGAWPVWFNYRNTHSADALCHFVAQELDITGPTATVVAACASSTKAFILAQRWIAASIVDAVIVGGVDSLCLSTLLGFNSLQLLSSERCCPFSMQRNGISIGEAAGFVLLSRESTPILFLGGGESSDAWSMTTPHPEGLGASEAMQYALLNAGLSAGEIGYVNAHGTASRSNDLSEAKALSAIFGANGVPVSSTKGVTGHTLGAAGIVEAIITITALAQQVLPPNVNTSMSDSDLSVDLITQMRPSYFRYAMTNNFGFGGANCSLIFGRDS